MVPKDLVNVGGITMVNGVVVDVEFITFNQGSLTRNRLLSDAEIHHATPCRRQRC